MHRVFSKELFSVGKMITIDESESHHVLRVLRLQDGDLLQLFDGKGTLAEAKIVELHKRDCVVEVLSLNKKELSQRVSVAFGIPKGQALDFILHRCTDLGANEFIPLVTEHSLKPNSWNDERWNKVLIEVCKQCQSAYLPTLHQPVKLKDWLKNRTPDRLLLFCDEEQRELKAPFIQSHQSVDLLTGPEGGWSIEEREEISRAGSVSFSLGAHRLRAETATLVALTLAKKLVGEI